MEDFSQYMASSEYLNFTKEKKRRKILSKNITWLSDKLPNSSAIEIDAADCKTFRPAMTPPLIVENSTYRKKKKISLKQGFQIGFFF